VVNKTSAALKKPSKLWETPEKKKNGKKAIGVVVWAKPPKAKPGGKKQALKGKDDAQNKNT